MPFFVVWIAGICQLNNMYYNFFDHFTWEADFQMELSRYYKKTFIQCLGKHYEICVNLFGSLNLQPNSIWQYTHMIMYGQIVRRGSGWFVWRELDVDTVLRPGG